jgi:septal ring-binding cell division protein DamX
LSPNALPTSSGVIESAPAAAQLTQSTRAQAVERSSQERSEKATPSRLPSDAIKRIAAYPTGKNNLLKSRIEATRERLDREPDGSYSIELFSTDNSDPGRVERFLVRAREVVSLEDLLVLPQGNGGRYRIRVTFGGYPDRDTAAQAVEALPAKYKQAFRPELRSFAELRESL